MTNDPSDIVESYKQKRLDDLKCLEDYAVNCFIKKRRIDAAKFHAWAIGVELFLLLIIAALIVVLYFVMLALMLM